LIRAATLPSTCRSKTRWQKLERVGRQLSLGAWDDGFYERAALEEHRQFRRVYALVEVRSENQPRA